MNYFWGLGVASLLTALGGLTLGRGRPLTLVSAQRGGVPGSSLPFPHDQISDPLEDDFQCGLISALKKKKPEQSAKQQPRSSDGMASEWGRGSTGTGFLGVGGSAPGAVKRVCSVFL